MTTKNDEKKVEKKHGMERIPLKDIRISPLNPRSDSDGDVKGLGEDVQDKGLLQPITLRPTEDGGFEAVIGSRRTRAIVAKRGPTGFLEPSEYDLVNWDDEFCIRAAVAENAMREDLSLYEEGTYLNRIAGRDPTLTDQHLATLTGFGNRQHVNQLRDLANVFPLLPDSWQKNLRLPQGRRLGDTPGISLTHFKHVRTYISSGGIVPGIRDLMEKAAAKGWSAAEFNRAIHDATLGRKEAASGTPDPTSAEGGRSVSEGVAAGEDGPKSPDYKRVRKSLEAAMSACRGISTYSFRSCA